MYRIKDAFGFPWVLSKSEFCRRENTQLIARKLSLIVFLGGCCSALTRQRSLYNDDSIFDTNSLQQRPIILVAHSEFQWFVVMLHRNHIFAVAKPVAALKSFERGTHIK